MRRKPTKKEIFFGCIEFSKMILNGIFTFDISKVQMGWGFLKLTAQGKFEVEEEKSDWNYDYNVPINKTIEIVNQLAEEYNHEPVKGDLISRSALLKTLNEYVKKAYDCGGIDDENVIEYQQTHDDKSLYIIEGFYEVYELLGDIPTAYNDGWILCSERLPDKSGYYLMSVENYGSSDRDMVTPNKEVWIRRFHKGKDGDKWQNIWQQMPYETFDVIAWKPLPAPYLQNNSKKCEYGTPTTCDCHECTEPCDYAGHFGRCDEKCVKYYNCNYCANNPEGVKTMEAKENNEKMRKEDRLLSESAVMKSVQKALIRMGYEPFEKKVMCVYKAIENTPHLGTVEEFNGMKEKTESKKMDEDYCCPVCHTSGLNGAVGKYCSNCGQKID